MRPLNTDYSQTINTYSLRNVFCVEEHNNITQAIMLNEQTESGCSGTEIRTDCLICVNV